MAQRQRAQPALVLVEPERDRRAQRAPQQVSVAELDRSRRAGGARGVDHDRRGLGVVAGAPRQRALAPRAAGRSKRRLEHTRRRRGDMRALACGQAQVDRHGDRPVEQARVQRLGELQTGGQADRNAIARAHAAVLELARAALGRGEKLLRRYQLRPASESRCGRGARRPRAASHPSRSMATG